MIRFAPPLSAVALVAATALSAAAQAKVLAVAPGPDAQERLQTALLDAVGRTIDDVGARLASLPEDQRPAKVIIAIFTDGLENASRVFTTEKLAASIKHQQEKYGWEFLFLAANQDAIATAATIAIPASQAMNYVASPVGVRDSYEELNKRVTQSRQAKN